MKQFVYNTLLTVTVRQTVACMAYANVESELGAKLAAKLYLLLIAPVRREGQPVWS